MAAPAVLALAAVGGAWLISFAMIAANTGIAILLLARDGGARHRAAYCRGGAGRRAGGLRLSAAVRRSGTSRWRWSSLDHERRESAGRRSLRLSARRAQAAPART
jgi:apolipoprotein N-acyltransferase